MRRTTRSPKPRPVPEPEDPTYHDWPRIEVRHLLKTLPDTSLGHWRRGTS